MSVNKTNAFETEVLDLVFTNTNIASIGDGTGVRGASAASNIWVGLYTVAPTDTTPGTEVTTGEYTNYARIAVARSGVGWTVAGNNCSNAGLIQFANCSGGTGCTAVAVGLHFLATGSTLFMWSDLDADLNISVGVQPVFQIGELDITES